MSVWRAYLIDLYFRITQEKKYRKISKKYRKDRLEKSSTNQYPDKKTEKYGSQNNDQKKEAAKWSRKKAESPYQQTWMW